MVVNDLIYKQFNFLSYVLGYVHYKNKSVLFNSSFSIIRYVHCLALIRDLLFYYSFDNFILEKQLDIDNLFVIFEKCFKHYVFNIIDIVTFDFYVSNYFFNLLLPRYRVVFSDYGNFFVDIFFNSRFINFSLLFECTYIFYIKRFFILKEFFDFFVLEGLSFPFFFNVKIFHIFFELELLRFFFNYVNLAHLLGNLNFFLDSYVCRFINFGCFFVNQVTAYMDLKLFQQFNVILLNKVMFCRLIFNSIDKALRLEFSKLVFFYRTINLSNRFMFSLFVYNYLLCLFYLQLFLFGVLENTVSYYFSYKLFVSFNKVFDNFSKTVSKDEYASLVNESNSLLLFNYKELQYLLIKNNLSFPFFNFIEGLFDFSKPFPLYLTDIPSILKFFINFVIYFFSLFHSIFPITVDLSMMSYSEFLSFFKKFCTTLQNFSFKGITFEPLFEYRLCFIYFSFLFFFYLVCVPGDRVIDYSFFVKNGILNYFSSSEVLNLNIDFLVSEICSI